MRLHPTRLCLLAVPALALAPCGAWSADTARAPLRAGEAVFEGTFEAVGHYSKPGDTRQYDAQLRFFSDGRGAARADWAIWSEGDTSRVK